MASLLALALVALAARAGAFAVEAERAQVGAIGWTYYAIGCGASPYLLHMDESTMEECEAACAGMSACYGFQRRGDQCWLDDDGDNNISGRLVGHSPTTRTAAQAAYCAVRSTTSPRSSQTPGPTAHIGANMDFESDLVSDYIYMVPSGWTGAIAPLIRSGSFAWGGTAAAEGNNFLGLQGGHAYVEQHIANLAGGPFALSLQRAARPGGFFNPSLTVTLNSVVMYQEVDISDAEWGLVSVVVNDSMAALFGNAAIGEHSGTWWRQNCVCRRYSDCRGPDEQPNLQPDIVPDAQPDEQPDEHPTPSPTSPPTPSPTSSPTPSPSSSPTSRPTNTPTSSPTSSPTPIRPRPRRPARRAARPPVCPRHRQAGRRTPRPPARLRPRRPV
ncbi:unnamed protein product [Prorocentrum cordatum]|uniref:Apple domain-containing protein n=1 Tax=Prorocentrum cordatum TaxID=2364126 RepID=A0ABN9Q765_9DINO|nr:unnamed protein product [Polarella glacialis]